MKEFKIEINRIEKSNGRRFKRNFSRFHVKGESAQGVVDKVFKNLKEANK